MSNVLVLGSLNIDWIIGVDMFPRRGETLLAKNFERSWGGKGANQAVALSRLGAAVSMLGCVGNDDEGREYIQFLKQQGVDTNGIVVTRRELTGKAIIYVNKWGENQIVVVPGANYEASVEWLENQKTFFLKNDVLLLQLELPIEVVERAIELGYEAGMKVILNPAPVRLLSRDIYLKLDAIIPNEQEAIDLTGAKTADEAANVFLEWGCKQVIVTRGGRGVSGYRRDEAVHVPSENVTVVDTTGAGDCFVAGFTWATSVGMSFRDSLVFANRLAGISVTKKGTIPSYPNYEELKKRGII